MLKTSVFLIILFISILDISAQTVTGLTHDLNGNPFYDYYDPFLYSPDEKLNKVYSSPFYENGYYFNESGNKVSGMIKFRKNKVYFRKDEIVDKDVLNPETVKKIQVGGNTFITISNFHYLSYFKKKPAYAQYIAEINGHTFVKYYKYTQVVPEGVSNIKEYWLVKSEKQDTWENIAATVFKDKSLKYFGYIPYLRQKIESEFYKYEDMLSIIKMAEYLQRYKGHKTISYDKYWQETTGNYNAEYVAKITEKKDTIWTFEYFKDSLKTYSAQYSSFYPNIKNGDFTSYYSNGDIKQVVNYKNNQTKEVKRFNEKGLLVTHYKYVETKNEDSEKKLYTIKYLVINNLENENIFPLAQQQKVNIVDAQSKRVYNGVFVDHQLKDFYRIVDLDTIFQITNKSYNLKLTPLEHALRGYLEYKKCDLALSENAQGVILLQLVLNAKGYVQEGVRLNSIHPELDSLIDDFIKVKLLKGSDVRQKLKPYKRNKIKKSCEFVIPIEFSTTKFYQKPSYYYPNHHLMHQQMYNTQQSYHFH